MYVVGPRFYQVELIPQPYFSHWSWCTYVTPVAALKISTLRVMDFTVLVVRCSKKLPGQFRIERVTNRGRHLNVNKIYYHKLDRVQNFWNYEARIQILSPKPNVHYIKFNNKFDKAVF